MHNNKFPCGVASWVGELKAMLYEDNYLAHHGIKGQRWGIRRFQDENGILTEEGRRRYGYTDTATGGKQNISSDRDLKKFMKYANQANQHGASGQKAQKKMLKTKKMQEILNDQDIQRKTEAYKKVKNELIKESKGNDYDAYDPDNYNYGISKEKFQKIRDLTDQKHEAYTELSNTVKERVKEFTSSYSDQPLSEANAKNFRFKDVNDLIAIVAEVELNKQPRTVKFERQEWDEEVANRESKNREAFSEKTPLSPSLDKKVNADLSDDVWNMDYDSRVKFQKSQLNDLMSISNKKDRDNALTEYMRLHSSQDNYGALVDRMMEKSGDLLSGNSTTEENRQAKDEYWNSVEREQAVNKKLSDQAAKQTRNYEKQKQIKKELEQKSPEALEASKQRYSSFEKYCKVVLKDMGMPINDKTIAYIQGIIFWN